MGVYLVCERYASPDDVNVVFAAQDMEMARFYINNAKWPEGMHRWEIYTGEVNQGKASRVEVVR